MVSMSTTRDLTEHSAKHTLAAWSGCDYCPRCAAPIVHLVSKRTGGRYRVNATPTTDKAGNHKGSGWLHAVNDFHKCAPDAVARFTAIKNR
jgi:hypothetical protein